MEKEVAQLFNDSLLRTAMDVFRLEPAIARPLDGFENFVYECTRGGRPYILRLSHSSKKALASTVSELHWVNYLADHGVSVARAIESGRGKVVEVIPATDDSYFVAVAFEKAPGRHPVRDDFSPRLYMSWGGLIGRIHALSRTYRPASEALNRPHWYEEVEVTRAEYILPADQDLVLQKFRTVVAEMGALPREPRCYGLVHNDAHPGNFVVDGERITLFDFEDSIHIWYAADVASCLFHITASLVSDPAPEAFARQFLRSFLAGYYEENDLDGQWLYRLALFLKFREISQYIVIYRACDPAHLDPWSQRFMLGRRERIEQDVPYLNLTL